MAKGRILRLPAGLKLTEDLEASIAKIVPNYTKEYFSAEPDYKESFERRADSLHKALLFAFDAYPIDPKFTSFTKDALITHAEKARSDCNFSNKSVEELNAELGAFTDKLISYISISRKWKEPHADAVACLNEAEQYQIMLEGRSDIATLTPMEFADGKGYVIQFDEALAPHYPQLIDELKAIKALKYPKTAIVLNNLDELEKNSDQLEKTKKIPAWYWELTDHEQHFLAHVLEKSNSIEEAISFIPSRLRTIPAPANFGTHQLFAVNSKGVLEPLSEKRYRSSHVASRDVMKCSKEIQERHAESNFAKVIEAAKDKAYILMQTLISPLYDWLPLAPPDTVLYNIANETVQKSSRASQVLQHNHPFNYAKYLNYTGKNDAQSLKLIAVATGLIPTKPNLAALVDIYKNVLNSKTGTATILDQDARELYLSSLEQLIILEMDGFSYGSCVSGKDRKAIELIHTDALILFKKIYGYWPRFCNSEDKEARQNFTKLVANLYCTRHQHVHAGQNAPGSEGIKTPDVYLPKDICRQIKKLMGKNAIRNDDVLATNNEVKTMSISGGVVFQPNFIAQLTALTLGVENCNLLYTKLWKLINEKSLFTTLARPAWSVEYFVKEPELHTPTGIAAIDKLMGQARPGATSVDRMGDIFAIISGRPESDTTRTTATKLVYESIRSLLQPKANLEQLVPEIVKAWEDKFEESKRENVQLNSGHSSMIECH